MGRVLERLLPVHLARDHGLVCELGASSASISSITRAAYRIQLILGTAGMHGSLLLGMLVYRFTFRPGPRARLSFGLIGRWTPVW